MTKNELEERLECPACLMLENREACGLCLGVGTFGSSDVDRLSEGLPKGHCLCIFCARTGFVQGEPCSVCRGVGSISLAEVAGSYLAHLRSMDPEYFEFLDACERSMGLELTQEDIKKFLEEALADDKTYGPGG